MRAVEVQAVALRRVARVEDGVAVIETAIGFESPFGRRVLLSATPTETFVTFLSGTLARLPRYAGARAWVLDANGRVRGRAGAARQLRTPSPEIRASMPPPSTT